MAFASANHLEPFGEMNTTPLIDVMLVLLIMLTMTIPLATDAVPIDLPSTPASFEPSPIQNKIEITAADAVEWNGRPVAIGELAALLARTRQLAVEPELQYEPSPDASYDAAAQVLNVIHASGVTKFGFVGNEKYRVFGK